MKEIRIRVKMAGKKEKGQKKDQPAQGQKKQ
ncbi:hypothetical protein IC006_2246 [Sulfuracidifex tepidarius]|uniref:Uncharacterized protein n=1 Tax=Sulfuracidifex tepidarius TaxID=1294262 RepID=A0A510E5I1_9CREN|nr:hypothetical protein IC006_2246 [Sulfuracidifex tepidarius]BBG27697.1 hypothetical protein IC007_2251 [Sulfuracidifex tepidarius]